MKKGKRKGRRGKKKREVWKVKEKGKRGGRKRAKERRKMRD